MGIRGQNYYKVVEMKLTGITSSRIAINLNISRERVRQLWISYQTNNNSEDPRICSKCNKEYIPTHEFQSTCGCRVTPFENCVICGKITQFFKRSRTYPICKNIKCIENLRTLKNQTRKLSLEKRDRTKTEVICPVCNSIHLAPVWRAMRSNFKMRCKSCIKGQKIDTCTVCEIPISGPNGRCMRHHRRRVN